MIIETVGQLGARSVMAQRFIPEIVDGDKRILLIAGEPVPYCARAHSQARARRAAISRRGARRGAPALARATARSREALGPKLWAEGLLVVGLDVIGDYLTEVNVTSPTCFVEIAEQTRLRRRRPLHRRAGACRIAVAPRLPGYADASRVTCYHGVHCRWPRAYDMESGPSDRCLGSQRCASGFAPIVTGAC